MKLNVAWRGHYPVYLGVGDTLRTKHEHGVAVIKSKKELDSFIENMSVDYGEQGGWFQIMFGWEGNIRSKDSRFYSAGELHRIWGIR